MNTIRIRLPWPPSANDIWRTRIVRPREGKWFPSVYLSEEAVAYRQKVERVIQKEFGDITGTRSRLRVTLVACAPDRRKRDLTNLLKATEDALTESRLWEDDSQIDEQSQTWAKDGMGRRRIEFPGWVELVVEQLTDEPARQKTLLETT